MRFSHSGKIFDDKKRYVMKYTMTSAQAAKVLRKLNDDRNSLYMLQNNSKEFVAAVGEDIESVRPNYDFAEMQVKIDEIDTKIRTLKHCINVFNTTTKVEGFDMTIDEVLVYIPQLTTKRGYLSTMKSRLPKVREDYSGRASSIIDYRYLNYDLKQATDEFERISTLLSELQTALDLTNSTKTLEVDF